MNLSESWREAEPRADHLRLVDAKVEACEYLVGRIMDVLNSRTLTFLSKAILAEEFRAFQNVLEEAGLEPDNVGGISFAVWERIDAASNGRDSAEINHGGIQKVIAYIEQLMDPKYLAQHLKEKYRRRFCPARMIGLVKGQAIKRFQGIMEKHNLDLRDMEYIGRRIYEEMSILVGEL